MKKMKCRETQKQMKCSKKKIMYLNTDHSEYQATFLEMGCVRALSEQGKGQGGRVGDILHP